MDTTPVMRRSRSKLSRRDRGLHSPSPRAVCADRRPSDSSGASSTPLRAPPAEALCWDSPVSPFSPPPLSQTCEVYWEDEVQRRTAEALKRAVHRPGDRVPPVPAPLAASPAPLLPAGRRRTTRATKQQHQQLMALLERAETLCGKPASPAAPVHTDTEQASPRAVQTETEPEQAAAAGGRYSDTAALPEIESDPELDRSLLRCTQQAERAAPATPGASPARRSHSFSAFVMDAMPDDEDEIFSQIPDEALDGEVKTAGAESSSGVSSGSSGVQQRTGGGRGMPRTVSAPDYRPPGEKGRRWTAETGAGRGSSQVISRPGMLSRVAENPAASRGQTNGSAVTKPTASNNSVMRPSSVLTSAPARQSIASNSAVMMKTHAASNSAVRPTPASVATSSACRPQVSYTGSVPRPQNSLSASVSNAQSSQSRPPPIGASGVAASIRRLPSAAAGAGAASPQKTGAADPARQKAEMNRRRAEALRRLRQNQRARSLAASQQAR